MKMIPLSKLKDIMNETKCTHITPTGLIYVPHYFKKGLGLRLDRYEIDIIANTVHIYCIEEGEYNRYISIGRKIAKFLRLTKSMQIKLICIDTTKKIWKAEVPIIKLE